MRRIRRLIFKSIYQEKQYEGKRISNLIYELMPGRKFADLPEVKPPSRSLQDILNEAVRIPTTLWFEETHELPCLVASGQTLICYNLIEYIVRVYGKEPAQYPVAIRTLWFELTQDWKTSNDRPYTFLEELMPGMKFILPPPR